MDNKKMDNEGVIVGDILDGDSEPVQMKRDFNFISLVALGFNISDSWVAIAASLPLAIAGGGTVTLLYGILIVCFTMTCTGLSLAELASVYPTAGGQYHLTSLIAPRKHSRWISYVCGLVGVFSWVAICSSVSLFFSQFIWSLVRSYHPEFQLHSWHYFVMYQAAQILAVLYNVYGIKKTVWIYDTTCFVSIALLITITILCPTMSSARPSSKEVWTNFVNSSGGWSNGISFLTGLSTPSYMLLGLDATMHLAEECVDPARVIPKAIMLTVITGLLAAFTFAVGMCYSVRDVSSFLADPTMTPIFLIWEQASNSKACMTVFAIAATWFAFIGIVACHQTASRLTWSFAGDRGLVMSNFFDQIHPRLKVPVNALLLNFAACFLIGILYLVSSSSFNAFIGSANILSTLSVAMPVACILYHNRSSEYLLAHRSFRLPAPIGYFCNTVTVVWSILITVFFCFPTMFPLTGANMNYSVAVLGIMFTLALVNWFIHANKRYAGPQHGHSS